MMDPLAPGREVGRYRVVRRLAVGGMAEIYLAQARGIDRFEKYVVLKRILPQYAASPHFIEMFKNEARIAATLDHPNIASVYDIGEAEGVYFFTMEYLHGEDLGFVLRELLDRGQHVPLNLALTIGAGVAAGLHAAHEKCDVDGLPLGIVHRDVSPSNVVVTYHGGVKLVDFGVAKVTAAAGLTKTGTLKGKIGYMSPEQCANEGLDRRSDVFSLGVLLYELCTRSRLFRADSEAGTLRLVLSAEIPPPSERMAGFPSELEPILYKALARSPDDRYPSARDLQLALEQVASGQGIVLSTAKLAEWMTSTFGHKPEPWVGLSKAGPTDNAATVVRRPRFFSAELEAANRFLTPGPGAVAATGEGGTPEPAAVAVPVRPFHGSLGPWKLFVLAACALLVGAGGTAFFLRTESPPSPPRAAAAPPAADERLALAESDSPPTAAAVAQAEPAPPRPPARPERRTRRARRPERPRGGDRSQHFSAAFARKEGDLLRCFSRFSPPGRGPQLSVRFQLEASGKVNAVEVFPAEISGTPLAQCVAQVAQTTRFVAQPAPVTFRIPVVVRRLEGAGP